MRKIFLFATKWKLVTFIPMLVLSYNQYHLNKDYDNLHDKYIILEMTKKELISNMIVSNFDLDDIPLAISYKVKRGNNFINSYCNKAYEVNWLLKYGNTRTDFINKTVFDIYPKKEATIYNNRDLDIAKKGGYKMFMNKSVDTLGNEFFNYVKKWRKIKRNDTLIGVLVYPKNNKL